MNNIETNKALYLKNYDVEVSTGLMNTAFQSYSPNQDERPVGVDPSLIVLHGISLPPGKFGGSEVENLFMNKLDFEDHPYFTGLKNLKVSAHLFLRRDGRLIQFVPLNKRAWHAGDSFFRGQYFCNDFSIGIELEGCDEKNYSKIQYSLLSKVIKGIFRAYPNITIREIAGHSDIAPGRKTDPGPSFDWLKLYKLLNVDNC